MNKLVSDRIGMNARILEIHRTRSNLLRALMPNIRSASDEIKSRLQSRTLNARMVSAHRAAAIRNPSKAAQHWLAAAILNEDSK